MTPRDRSSAGSPKALVVLRGLAVAAAAFALVFGTLTIFGTDESTSVAIVPAVDIGTTGNGSTATTAVAPRVAGVTATAPPAADPEAAAGGAPTSTAAPSAGGTAPTDPASPAPLAGGTPAPATEPPGPSGPPPTSPPVTYPSVSVFDAGGSIGVSMSGFSPGQSLSVGCYALGWIPLGSFSRVADGGGGSSGSCSDGGVSNTHVYAQVNGSVNSNHLEWKLA
jgi:hypothetical protein